MKKWIIIFLLSFPLIGFSSNFNEDSLWKAWNNPQISDSLRFSAINSIIWKGYMFSNTDSAYIISKIHLKKATEMNDKYQMAIATNSIGVTKALKGYNDSALIYFEKCVELNLESNNQKNAAAVLNNIGLINKNQGKLDKAIDYYKQSLELREKIQDTAGMLNSLNNISIIYIELKEYEKGLESLDRCLGLISKVKDTQSEAITYNNLGRLYEGLGKYESAIESIKQAIHLFKELNSTRNVGLLTSNIGAIYADMGEPDSAITYCNRALEIGNQLNDQEIFANAKTKLSKVYLKSDINKAVKLSKEAYESALQINSLLLQMESSEILYKALKKKGEYNQAIDMYEIFVGLKDSIASEDNLKEVLRYSYQYEYANKVAADSIKAQEEAKVTEAEIAQKNAEIEKKKTEGYLLYGGIGVITLFALFIFNRFRVTNEQKKLIEVQKKEVEAQKEIAEEQKHEADHQRHLVEEKNQEIMDSIQYAKRIQTAILPPNKDIEQYFGNGFILYKPKDVVAGDFYWIHHKNDSLIFAAADCTGHGVPGAMVSVVCNNGLNRAVREFDLSKPGEILDKTRELVIQQFEKSEEEVKDGMDIAMCSISGNELKYAGAHNPLWIIRKDSTEVEEIKANKQPIGKTDNPLPYTTHELELQKGDTIYIFSDGYADQFGGERGKKFKAANFKRLLLSIQHEPMSKQKELIDIAFADWKGDHEQIDDVCVIGYRFS